MMVGMARSEWAVLFGTANRANFVICYMAKMCETVKLILVCEALMTYC